MKRLVLNLKQVLFLTAVLVVFFISLLFSKYNDQFKVQLDQIQKRINQFQTMTTLHSLYINQYSLYHNFFFLHDELIPWFQITELDDKIIYTHSIKYDSQMLFPVTTFKIESNGAQIAKLHIQIDQVKLFKKVLFQESVTLIYLSMLILLFGLVLYLLNLKNIARYQVILTLLSRDTSITPTFVSTLEEINQKTVDLFLKKFLASIIAIFHDYLRITEKLIVTSKQAAIASTVTTLAHDVRRPFTLVQAVLDSFESFVKDPSSLKQAKQDIKQAINQVQGMISDIMDFSREVKLTTKPTPLEPVLLFSLNQVFQKELKAQISLTYQLHAKKVPLLDDGRITRVFANLIGNAVEAITVMGEKSYGEITFTSKDITIDHKQWVEISISNDGPPFPEGVEQKLFESFFTSGKNSGTGLGLASCQKIVKLHSGSISAKNLPDNEGVVFTMLIPASDQLTEPYTERLPPSNQAIWKSYEYSLKNAPSSTPEVHLKEQTTILLLEDEALYKAWVRQLINGNDQLRLNVLLLEASNVPEAISIIQAIPIHYAIVDIDLNHAQTGFDFLQFLQNEQIPIPSLVHSNRTLAEFQEKALSLGAKSFTPKPLPIGALITFLQNHPPSSYVPPVTDINDRTPITSNSSSFSLYYSDDSSINHRMFEYMVEEFNANHQPVYIEAFSFMNGEALLEAFKQKPADVVLTDQNMGHGAMKGLELLKTIHEINPNTHLYVLSNEDVEDTMPQVKELGGHGAFEPPWRVKILESIYHLIM